MELCAIAGPQNMKNAVESARQTVDRTKVTKIAFMLHAGCSSIPFAFGHAAAASTRIHASSARVVMPMAASR